MAITPISAAFTVTSNAGDTTTSGSLLQLLASTISGSGHDTITATIAASAALPNNTITLASNLLLPGVLTLDTHLLSNPLTLVAPLFSQTVQGELIKAGTGTLILSGPSSYTGGTEVQAGTLQGTPSSIFGNVTVDAGATLDILPIAGTSSLGQRSSFAGGVISLAGGSAFIDFGGSSTLAGGGTSLGGSSAVGGAHTTLRNFQLGDYLDLQDFTDQKNTTASISGSTLTVSDLTHSVSFGLANSLTDDPGNETVVVLRDSIDGSALVTPAVKVTDQMGGDTGVGSLRHALSVIGQNGGVGDVVLFDPALNGQIISLLGSVTVGGVVSATPTTIQGNDVKFHVPGGEKVTINGVSGAPATQGSLISSTGFHKNGGGTLTLTGNESSLNGSLTVTGGTLDIETSTIGSSALVFKTGFNATIASTTTILGSKGWTVNGFVPGDTLKINNIDFAGPTTLTSTVSSGAGSLSILETTAEGSTIGASIAIANSALPVTNVGSSFVLLRDSTDGSALIRPAFVATDGTSLTNAVTAVTGSNFSGTSFDVIDLTSAVAAITLGGALALGSNPILFDTSLSGSSATINGSLSGTNDFFKVGEGTLTLQGDQSALLGTITVGGGDLVIGTTQFSSTVSAVDLSPGHGTVEGTAANLAGLHVTNFHLGDAIRLVPAVGSDTIVSSFGTPGGNVTLSELGTAPTSNSPLTISFTPSSIAGGGFTTLGAVPDGTGGQMIVPAVATGQTISGGTADLGQFTDILSGGTLLLTNHGTNSGQFFGAGTLKISLPGGADQAVKLSNANSGIGANSSISGFTGALQIDSGLLDLSTAGTLAGSIGASLTGPHTQLNVNANAGGHLTLSSIAGGAAIDVTNITYASLDLVDSGIFSTSGGGAVLQLNTSPGVTVFQATLPSSALAFAGSGGLQLLSDGATGTVIAFGNDTISVGVNTVFPGVSLGSGVKPLTLSITGSLFGPVPVLDLSNLLLGASIKALDVSALGTATVRLNAVEGAQLGSITGSGSTTLQLVTDGTVFNAIQNFNLNGISTIDLAGHNQTLVIGAGSPPTTLKTFHGNADGTDSIMGTGATMDMRGILFTGNGHITGSVGPTTYIVSDGNALTHIDNFSGSDTINLVDTTQLAATYTPDEIAYALGHNFTLQLNGAAFPTSGFTPPGGEPVTILATTNPVFAGTAGVFTLSGSLAVSGGVTHFALPSGTSFNLSNLTVTGGSAADPIVFFGAPGSTVSLPNNVPGGGQSAVEFVVNGGNNVITAGSATAQIWGGPGNDSVTLTNGAGTVVGGAGTATLNGGSAGSSVYGGAGTVELFGASGGGTLSNGGDHSELVSGGGITTLNANTIGVLHQAFFGSQDTIGGFDTFNLVGAAGSQEIVTAGAAPAVVNGHLSNDTILAGSGTIMVIGGTTSENLTFIAKQSSGGTERATVSGGGAGTLVAYGGDGADSLAASNGNSTIIGGSGTDTFFGSHGTAYMLSQGTKDSFQFSDVASAVGAANGTFFVEGFTTGTDKLQITPHITTTASAVVAAAVQVTITNTDISPTDTIAAHLIGTSALQITLSQGQKIDLVGVTTLPLTDISVTNPL